MKHDEKDKTEKANETENEIENQVDMNASLESLRDGEVSSIFEALNKGHHSPA